MSVRAGGASLLVIGVVIGTLADRRPNRAPVRAGEYWILSGDFHVHAFPGDGSLAPWVLRDEAARAGLDVIAVTNHNKTFTARFAEWLARSSDGPIVVAGQEITNPDYHLSAVGLQRTVNAFQPAAAAIADVHAQGGIAIAAHPARDYSGWDDTAVAALDGAELAHPAMHVDENERQDFVRFFERARTVNPGIAPIGSSDFHASPALGRCRTYVFARERSAAAVLEAIRSGRTVAADANGRLYGAAPLVQLVEAQRPAGRTDPQAGWRRTSIALAWIGMLVVTLASKGLRNQASGIRT